MRISKRDLQREIFSALLNELKDKIVREDDKLGFLPEMIEQVLASSLHDYCIALCFCNGTGISVIDTNGYNYEYNQLSIPPFVEKPFSTNLLFLPHSIQLERRTVC